MSARLEFDCLLNLLAPAMLGGGLVWATTGLRWRRAKDGQDALINILEFVGWLLVVGSIMLAASAYVAAPMFAVYAVVFVVALVVTRRYRETTRRALCSALAIAAQRSIPLGEAARAFAGEPGFAGQARIRRFGELLDAGVRLDEAIRRAGVRFPREVMLAVRIRGLAADLGPVLRETTQRASAVEAVVSSALEKVFYFLSLAALGILLVKFVTPIFLGITEEFYPQGEPLASRAVVSIAAVLSSGSLGGWLIIGLVILFTISLLAYLRWLPFEVPLVRRLWFALDGSSVLYCLSLAVRHDQPITPILKLLSEHYPRARIRRRLRNVLNLTEEGGSWTRGLNAVGLLGAREAALLESAERLDNLAWALSEISERMLQRALLRFRRLLEVFFPLCLLLVGCFVLTIAAIVFIPLVDLLHWLN